MGNLKLSEDLGRICAEMNVLGDNPDYNFEVVGENYLDPKKSKLVFPLGHPDGSYKYFSRIKKVIIKALKYGNISLEELPLGAPEHLEQLVR